MSILQEYEEIKKEIGQEKWDSFYSYLSQHPELSFDKIIYNAKNWQNFNNWFNENIQLKKVEVLSTWATDYDDIRCNAILYKNQQKKANIIASYDETDIRYSIGDSDTELTDEFVTKAFKTLIYDDFDSFLNLPKISECSRLLQEIYDNVCCSDSTMCHITDEDWEEQYSDNFTENDLDILQEEITRFHLEDIVTINQEEYKIVGYGDLETRFNNDRNLNQNLEESIEIR